MDSNIIKFVKPKPAKVQLVLDVELDTCKGLYFKASGMKLLGETNKLLSIEEVASQILDKMYELRE